MGLLTCLSDPDAVLVADASTVINLNATACAEEILNALPNRVVVVDLVMEELEDGAQKGRNDASKLKALVETNLIEIVKLGSQGLAHFEGLVIGTASETLDDGEAATIAYGAESDACSLIDERKAIRVCARRFPELRLGCTVDLFAHPAVQNALGPSKLADAVVNALQHPRLDWVVTLIGIERASQCISLPYSVRKPAHLRR